MRKLSRRDFIFIGLIVCIFAAFIIRFGFFQIVKGKEYSKVGESVASQVINVKASRGEILDRNGTPLVANRQGNAIVFYGSDFPEYSKKPELQKIRNEEILALIRLFESRGEEWIDCLPLEINEDGQVAFKENSDNDISAFKSKDMLNLNSYATPDNCMDALIDRYSLTDYSTEDALKIGSVCYGMLKNVFNSSNSYTFADDVSDELVSIIKENSKKFPGVDVEIVTYREYTDPTLAPHIVGMVGNISAEEYAEKKDTYSMTDVIGKNGIELAMEDDLRGEDGYKTLYTDADGNTSTQYTKDPVQGNSVILTIDSKIQKVAQNALKNCLDELAPEIVGTAPAGSVVVLDVNSSDVLAAATYPSYNLEDYNKDYEKLAKDEAAPLWNRAFLSAYAPGSTMKPCVALAALNENVITEENTVFCSQIYEYKDLKLRCTGAHGSVNVVSAINYSCNSFFYEMGRLLGIDTLNKYKDLFGFGQKTGVEIDEAVGVVDSPEYRQSISQVWYPGFTLQSAIGNAGDLVTPIQLANYCATVANGGTRYKRTLLKSIKTYDYSTTVWENSPTIAHKNDISAGYYDLVREGMYLVGTVGFCADVFSKLPIKAGAKTGTSQVERYVNGQKVIATNGFLITFAPYENPQIAICVALEGGTSGASVAPVARDIYSYYFKSQNDDASALLEGVPTTDESVQGTTTQPTGNSNGTLLQ